MVMYNSILCKGLLIGDLILQTLTHVSNFIHISSPIDFHGSCRVLDPLEHQTTCLGTSVWIQELNFRCTHFGKPWPGCPNKWPDILKGACTEAVGIQYL